MAYRSRYSRGYARSRMSPRRHRRRIPDAAQPRKWNRSNFHFSQTLTFLDSQEIPYHTDNVVLASIKSFYSGWSDVEAARQMASKDKRMLIGGIVLSRWMAVSFATLASDPGITTGAIAQMDCFSVLYADELDGDGALRTLPDWNANQTPVSVNPASDAEDVDFPTRIINRQAWGQRLQQADGGVVLTPTETDQINANISPYSGLPGTVRLRFRVALDDRTALVLAFAAADTNNVVGNYFDIASLQIRNSGTIYWRLV